MRKRRGLGAERHALLKVAIAGVAVVGFAAGWAGFASAHDAPDAVADGRTPTPVTPTPPPPQSPATGSPTATATATEPPARRSPDATPVTPKRSRGS